DVDDVVVVAAQIAGQRAQRVARFGPELRRVDVEQHVVAQPDVDLTLGRTVHVDAGDLAQFFFLLVHAMADRGADGRARRRADRRAGARAAGLIADHRPRHRAR